VLVWPPIDEVFLTSKINLGLLPKRNLGLLPQLTQVALLFSPLSKAYLAEICGSGFWRENTSGFNRYKSLFFKLLRSYICTSMMLQKDQLTVNEMMQYKNGSIVWNRNNISLQTGLRQSLN